MIEEIRITALGVIDESLLELGPGLSVITGETGAGKTMVVTALGLLLGGRADSGAVRTGARAARVEGRFRIGEAAAEVAAGGIADQVEDLGGVVEDDSVLLARQVAAGGRSRAYVGGATVPISALGSLTDGLVAVHGQSDQHRLLRPEAQREALDQFASDEPGSDFGTTLASYREGYAELRAAERELREIVDNARERAREADLLRHGVGEIEAVGPAPGEDHELADQERRLGFADELRRASEEAREALSSEQDAPDVLGAMAAARRLLESVRDHDPAVAELADRLAEAAYVVSDLAADVASYASGVEADPVRLAGVSERRAALTALTRKYGETVADVLAWSEESSARLLELDGTDERIEQLQSTVQGLRSRLGLLADTITEQRTRAGARLGERVSEELTALAMPHATVSVAITPIPGDDFGPHGRDEVELLLAANVGGEPRPLGKGASGGELSRVMLALEVSMAGNTSVPTFVFDEVDAGVGGKAAVEVGRRLAMLARSAQVVVVTHLPQVAAFADHHVVVQKSSDGLVTTSGLTVLDEPARVRELSRMLAGLEGSETAVAHAEELLEAARRVRHPA